MNQGRSGNPSGTHKRLTFLLLLLIIWAVPSCGQQQEEIPASDVLTVLDSALSELGGTASTGLTRSQRWRMISSVGAGLPPANFDPSDLPDRESRGAGLLTAYCIQCHGIPTPQMHAAAEWPILVRRMKLRAATLRERMGGPLTRELIGDIRMSGFASSYVPSSDDTDTLIAYLQRNALSVAAPGDLGDDLETEFFIENCSTCHETPSPAAHTPADWGAVVARMQANMVLMDVSPLDDLDLRRITAYLQSDP
jgi:cytochrome c5